MKNTYFVLVAFLLSISVFGSNGKLSSINIKKIDFNNVIVTACCTQTASSGTPNTVSYVSITVTKCLGADSHAAARVLACGNAKEAANNSIQKLGLSSVTIQP